MTPEGLIALLLVAGYVVAYALCCVVVECVRALFRRRRALRDRIEALRRLQPPWWLARTWRRPARRYDRAR